MTNPPTPPLVLAVTATRQCGKDTLYSLLHTLEPRFNRWAFADRLKQDTAPLIREQFSYDPDTLTSEQKEIVRPLWIGYGMAQRAKDPLHWVKIVTGEILHNHMWRDDEFFAYVADTRFENEVSYLRERFGSAFRLVNLTREGAPPPTDEEEKHYQQVAAMADYNLHWGNDTEAGQRAHAQRLLEWLGVKTEQTQPAAA